MAIYNGPARGGTRGGKDQFDWEDVKEDKYNQNYLGHSVKAPVGRWQKNKDLDWYRKSSKVDLIAAQKAELQAAKERDRDLMAQMLGEKPMEAPKSDMTRIEKNKLYKRGDAEEGTVAAEIAGETFGERVEGLGYAPIKIDNLREQMDTTTHERQEGTAINDLLKAHAEGHPEPPDSGPPAEEDHDHAALLAAIAAAGSFGNDDGGVDPSDKKAMKKRMKKLEKEEKKRKKAEKKAAKREKKDGKRKRDDSDSDSDASAEQRRRQTKEEERKGGREEAGGRLREGEEQRRRGREEERGLHRELERRRSRSRDRSRDRDRRSRSRSRDRSRDRDRRSRSRSRDRRHRRD